MDHYGVLNVNRSSSLYEIKSQYRKLALQFHPDKCGDDNDTTRFHRIQEAFEVLSNASTKYEYDVAQGYGKTFIVSIA